MTSQSYFNDSSVVILMLNQDFLRRGEMWLMKLEASCVVLTFVGRIHTKLLARANVVAIYSAIPLQYLPFTPALQPCGVFKGRKRQLQEYGCYYTSLPKSP